MHSSLKQSEQPETERFTNHDTCVAPDSLAMACEFNGVRFLSSMWLIEMGHLLLSFLLSASEVSSQPDSIKPFSWSVSDFDEKFTSLPLFNSLSLVLSSWLEGLPPVPSAKAFGRKNRQSSLKTGLIYLFIWQAGSHFRIFGSKSG